MKFVRRRKWVRSHRLMGLVEEPSSLFSSMKDLHGNASRTKRKSATSSVSSGIVNNVNNVNNIKKKSVKKVTISSSRSSISTVNGAIDHEVADEDDEDDNNDIEDDDDDENENENDRDNNDDIYDEIDEDGIQNNPFPGSLSNPSDPNSGIRPPGTGTDDSNPTLYRQLVRNIS